MNQRQRDTFRNNDLVYIKKVCKDEMRSLIESAIEGNYGYVTWNGHDYTVDSFENFLKARVYRGRKIGWSLRLIPVNSQHADISIIVSSDELLVVGGYRRHTPIDELSEGDYVVHSTDRLRLVREGFSGITQVIRKSDENGYVVTEFGEYSYIKLHKLNDRDIRIVGNDMAHAKATIFCELCDNRDAIHYTREIGSGLRLCESCLNEQRCTCDDCGTDMIRYVDSIYALQDYPDSSQLCASCYREYGMCSNCGDRFEELDENGLCDSCQVDGIVKNYTYRPSNPPFFKVKNTNPEFYFGLELEVLCDSPNESAYNVLQTAPEDLLYFKEDGSLGGEGFELVTNPFSWGFYKKAKGDFIGILDELERQGTTAHSSCGIHIHVSRSAFSSQKHLYSFLRLVTAKQNRQFTEVMAGRSTDRWASLSNQGDMSTIIDKAKSKDRATGFGRYTAVNMDNSQTVEIRIFRSTLDSLEFMKNIEYVKAMIDHTRHMPIKEAVNALDFTIFALKSREYPALREWLLKNSNIIPRGPRAMIMANDVMIAKRQKSIKLRTLRYHARKIMESFPSKASCRPLYHSRNVEGTDDGVPLVIEAMKNVLQYDLQNSI